MLCKRLIPTILVRGKVAYKGQRFNATRSIGSALSIARTHAARGVDELCILDIAATAEGRGPDLELVKALADGCFIPITVGGGVRSLEHIDQLLRAGADKVCIGTALRTEPNLVRQAADRFGSQAIVVSMDVHGAGGITPVPARVGASWCGIGHFATYIEAQGAGEILLQSVDRDGMLCGYDLDLIREISSAVSIPVIASGGAGTYEHMLEAFKAGADACAAGALYAFTDNTPRGAAKFLKSHNIPVRL